MQQQQKLQDTSTPTQFYPDSCGSVPVAIIGGGPAGLCASNVLKQNNIGHILFEAGKLLSQRSQFDSSDVVHGIGGAGLFSDGKFSFYPSASKLWYLNKIQPAFDDILNLLCKYGIPKNEALKYQTDCNNGKSLISDKNIPSNENEIKLKIYPSLYLDFETRKNLISDLQECSSSNILSETMVTNIVPNNNNTKYNIFINGDIYNYIEAEYVIIAGGRFHPLFLCNNHLINKENIIDLGDFEFQRYEFGVRMETDSNAGFWTEYDQNIDPKYSFIDAINNNIQFRTFCCCRNGLVAETNAFGIHTFSGRADCEPTSRSNIGFLARLTDKNTDEFKDIIDNEIINWKIKRSTFNIELEPTSKIDENILQNYMGNESGAIITRGLNRLLKYFPALQKDNIKLYGPTLEGIGKYPKLVNKSLIWRNNYNNNKLLVAGDASGSFRGIVASMISGNYAARSIIRRILRK
eukprot:497219_1